MVSGKVKEKFNDWFRKEFKFWLPVESEHNQRPLYCYNLPLRDFRKGVGKAMEMIKNRKDGTI